MTRSHRYIHLLLLFVTLPFALTAQSNKAVIRLYSGNVYPEPNVSQWLQKVYASPPGQPEQVLLTFSSLPTEVQKKRLAQGGIELMDYLPDNTYSAILNYPINTELIDATALYSITAMQPEWKTSDYIRNTVKNNHGTIDVLVSFTNSVGETAIRQFITEQGGQITRSGMEDHGDYSISVDASKLRSIAQWYPVRYISPSSSRVPLDLQSRPAVKGNIAVIAPSLGGYGLAGDSVTVGVGDNASAIYHIDLKERVTNFNPVPMSAHGEHVNGIVGGAAIVDPLAASMAPHVSLVDFLYDQVLQNTGAMYNDYHMTITNNSYGILLGDCSYAGTYDEYSHYLDTLALQYPEVLHVFASGNDGGMDCSPYPHGFATVGGGFQPAKNNVVVGSMTDLLTPADDESKGPVKDGRLKPEIIAVGLGAYSTIGIDNYLWTAGTSMASPQVAGGVAILTQRYKQLNGGTQPMADLLKTVLLNGTMDLGTPGPDFTYGFGAMNLYRSLKILDNRSYTTGNILNGDMQSFAIAVPPSSSQLKVMLCWHDVPANPMSSVQLVNDLDLSVMTPDGKKKFPLVPDNSVSRVTTAAVEQEDHLNNVEQVMINNPQTGTYTITTKGNRVPSGSQRYIVAYDIIPAGIKLTYPTGSEQLSNVDTIRIFWEALSDGNTFTIEFSEDNGGHWTKFSNSVPADTRYFSFLPSGINSGNCLVKITRNNTGESMTSGRFAITSQPVIHPDASQCPGYINIHWSPIPGATSYELLAKKGLYMLVVGSTTDTSYTFSGMSMTDRSYVAVQPVISGIPGYRSLAFSTIANSGDCAKPVSVGDIAIEKILSPVSGRMFTSTQIPAISALQIKIRNLYTANCTNYKVSWQVNSGTWQSMTGFGNIPAKGYTIVTIPGLPLSSVGKYDIHVAIQNLDITDPQKGNDSTYFTIQNIPNDPINLTSAFTDDFETMSKFTANNDSIGVSPNGHWDFFSANDTGRMRSFVNDNITIGGQRSVSLDVNQNIHTGCKNNFTGTFNLSPFDTSADELRLDFDYVLHGTPRSADGNVLTARGNDGNSWNPVYTYDMGVYPGSVNHITSLSLTDALVSVKQNFSSSTQLSFGQNDTSLIAGPSYGNGMTIDNFKMYTVTNDASLVSVIAPGVSNCGLSGSVPLTVRVHNGVNKTLHNIALYYTIDSGTVYTGNIDSIKGKDNINYTFAKQIDITPGSTHNINTWLVSPGDSYVHNDSILNYHVRNNKVVSNYPYLENFEAGDGGYYSDGLNNSWQYGTPSASRINKAASGTKAWKTNLKGRYNNLERSYLYSPCFDVSSISNPMLSLSAALEIENCGRSLCDAAFIEYSFDGVSWSKLGTSGQGTNWYDSTFNVWNDQSFVRWHVVSIPVPVSTTGQPTRFRFVLNSDPGAAFDGFAIDDIHIFDLSQPILQTSSSITKTGNIAPGVWNNYVYDNKLLAAISPSEDLPGTSITLYHHDTLSNPSMTQYSMPRSYIATGNKQTDNDCGIRLYLTDSEVVQVMTDTTCRSCSPLSDAYSLGITQYKNISNTYLENGSLADDTGGVFSFVPGKLVTWVPYDKGYYAEFSTRSLSEFWFNNGGPTGNFPINKDYLNFLAFRNATGVATYWYTPVDTAINSYTVQRSGDGISFSPIADTPSLHHMPGQYVYIDTVDLSTDTSLYYRLQWTMTGKKGYYYSPIRKVSNIDSGASLVSFDAKMTSHEQVSLTWHSYIDPAVHYYKLDRAIEAGSFVNINNTDALNIYGRQYSITDLLPAGLKDYTPIHYRLSVILNDGTVIVLPERTIYYEANNSIVNIYPNPNFDGRFTVRWHADAGIKMQVNISDAVGRSLYQAQDVSLQWTNTTTISTPAGAKGVYFARIIIGDKKYSAKLVFE